MRTKLFLSAVFVLMLLAALFIAGCAGNAPGDSAGADAPAEENGLFEENAVNDPETPPLDTDPDEDSEPPPSGEDPSSDDETSGQPAEDGLPAVPPIIPVTSISLETTRITLDRNSEFRINYTVLPADATDKTVFFRSSDERVAAVTDDGHVFAVGAGTAVIECVASDEVSASCSVTVVVPVTGVSVSTNRAIYRAGETFDVSVGISPDDATDKTFTLNVSDDIIVSLSGNTISAVSSGRVTITATASNGVSGSKEVTIVDLEELAAEVFRLTNAQRQEHGLSDFSQNSALTAAGVVRAKECVVSFSHTRPDGRDPFSAFTENGVTFMRAAENIAAGQRSASEVVTGWMNSPGHRANILNANLNVLGVGVEMDSNGRLYWAQVFTD